MYIAWPRSHTYKNPLAWPCQRLGNLQAPLSHLPFHMLLFSVRLSDNDLSPSTIICLTSSRLVTCIDFCICFHFRVHPCPCILSWPHVLISTRSVAANLWLLSSCLPNPSLYTPPWFEFSSLISFDHKRVLFLVGPFSPPPFTPLHSLLGSWPALDLSAQTRLTTPLPTIHFKGKLSSFEAKHKVLSCQGQR